MESTFAGLTCKEGSFEVTIRGPLNAKTLGAVIRTLNLYHEWLAEDEAKMDLPKQEQS